MIGPTMDVNSGVASQQISIGIERLVIINLGLSAISIIGLVMAVFIGVGLVYKEMEKRTLYSLLAKPIRRSDIQCRYRWFQLKKRAGVSQLLPVLSPSFFHDNENEDNHNTHRNNNHKQRKINTKTPPPNIPSTLPPPSIRPLLRRNDDPNKRQPRHYHQH